MTLQEDIMNAVSAAIKSIGLDAFKKTSFFGSNEHHMDRLEISGWSRDIASYARLLRLRKTMLLKQSRDDVDIILRRIEERWPNQAKIFSDMRKEIE